MFAFFVGVMVFGLRAQAERAEQEQKDIPEKKKLIARYKAVEDKIKNRIEDRFNRQRDESRELTDEMRRIEDEYRRRWRSTASLHFPQHAELLDTDKTEMAEKRQLADRYAALQRKQKESFERQTSPKAAPDAELKRLEAELGAISREFSDRWNASITLDPLFSR